jgi:hypothetical protein
MNTFSQSTKANYINDSFTAPTNLIIGGERKMKSDKSTHIGYSDLRWTGEEWQVNRGYPAGYVSLDEILTEHDAYNEKTLRQKVKEYKASTGYSQMSEAEKEEVARKFVAAFSELAEKEGV